MLARCLVLSAALAAVHVEAHGHLISPKADFGSNKAMLSSFAGRFPTPNSIFPGSSFPDSGTKGNYEEFMKHFKNGTQSLKDIILANNVPLSGASKDCGFTQLGAAQELPAVLLWGKNEGTSSAEGFRPTHLGACETYCDDVLVQKNDECATAYNKPGNKGAAEVPIDVAKCQGAKQLTFYWLATQAKDEGGFQVYANCVALSGSGSASTPAPAPSGASSDAGDAPAPVKPNPATGADDDSNTPTSKTPKTKKPKKTKNTKKPKTQKPSEDDSSSAAGDADDEC